MESVRAALDRMMATGERDVDYWRDAVRWLVWASSVLQERSFCIAALQLLGQVCGQLGDPIRLDAIRRICSMRPGWENVEVLEKLVWLLAELVPETCREPVVEQFAADLVERVLLVGDLSALRVEIIPSLLRLAARLVAKDCSSLFYGLAALVVRDHESSGKALWTTADLLADRVRFDGGGNDDEDWEGLIHDLGLVLLTTSSLKAKIHVARCMRQVRHQTHCPAALAQYLGEMLAKCRRWLDNECVAEMFALEPPLFHKYRASLHAELASTSHPPLSSSPRAVAPAPSKIVNGQPEPEDILLATITTSGQREPSHPNSCGNDARWPQPTP